MKLAGVQNEVWNPPQGERFESLVRGLWLSNFTFSQFIRTLYIVYNIAATEIQRKMRQKSEFQVPQCIVYVSAFAVSPTSSEIRVRTTFHFKARVRINPFKGLNGYYTYRQHKHVKKIHSAYRAYACISCDFTTPSCFCDLHGVCLQSSTNWIFMYNAGFMSVYTWLLQA